MNSTNWKSLHLHLSTILQFYWLEWHLSLSSLCTFSSYWKQKMPHVCVNYILQSRLKHLVSWNEQVLLLRFHIPHVLKLPVSVLVFADAARSTDHSQLGFLFGLLIGEIQNGSAFFVIAWSSLKWKRPVKSVASAKYLLQVRPWTGERSFPNLCLRFSTSQSSLFSL